MKLSLLLLLFASGYEFPRDHFNHPEFDTEWWYYTGNLTAPDGREFGFELTFFRQANRALKETTQTVWDASELYLAHLALTDIRGQQFFHTERLNRAGPGIAGISAQPPEYWNGNWRVAWKNENEQQLQAVCDRFSLTLNLHSAKAPVIHGKDGLSLKGPGESSHYISLTRLNAEGELRRDGAPALKVSGLAWMDHEYFTPAKQSSIGGWDWFAIQLTNGRELMLYRIRDRAGNASAYSSGTIVEANGSTRYLASTDFVLSPEGAPWRSADSQASYPIAWNIKIPSLALDLQATTPVARQELYQPKGAVSPTYWEGAMRYRGTDRNGPVTGVGYLEMTGYNQALVLGR